MKQVSLMASLFRKSAMIPLLAVCLIWLCLEVAIVGYLLLNQPTWVAAYSAADQQSWEAWRAAANQMDGVQSPVKRRPPKSPEPPALVMLRDHFPVVISAAVVFSSAIYLFLVFILRGILLPPAPGTIRPLQQL
ncbi:MAG: hypothetical protein SFX18_19175 [Pirellulales bacterium]|nr:hypothetical protein [Pirellulales bacterium]